MRNRLLRAALAAVLVLVAAPATSRAETAPLTPLELAQQTAERLGTTLAPDGVPVASPNVDLLANVPGSYAGLKVVGKHAYATGWAGLTIFDISVPSTPRILSVLPIAHFENEDVDTDGSILLIAEDRVSKNRGNVLYVVDVRNQAMPKLASVLSLGDYAADERGPGHIANCVKDGCKWVWLTGGDKIWPVDLRDMANPKLLAPFKTPAANGSIRFGGTSGVGATHDVERDAAGVLFVTGSGGIAIYDGANPVTPRLLATSGRQGVDPAVNDFILHNSKHPAGSTLLVTEEDYLDDAQFPPGGCNGQGKFQTWNISGYATGREASLISQWKTEVSGTPFLTGNKAPVTVLCSSHWFTERKGIVANGWYEQGTRILDTRNPSKIRQIGYWLPPNAETWGAYWITDSIIYTADVARGIDVLQVRNATGVEPAPTVVAPIPARWLGAGTSTSFAALGPSPTFGYVCLVPKDQLPAV
jgi:hypothetical protein